MSGHCEVNTAWASKVPPFRTKTNLLKFHIAAQDYLAGKNRGVCQIPITLEIHSADIPDLTIIDLPGLTEVAVEGQDPQIVMQANKIIFFSKTGVKVNR